VDGCSPVTVVALAPRPMPASSRKEADGVLDAAGVLWPDFAWAGFTALAASVQPDSTPCSPSAFMSPAYIVFAARVPVQGGGECGSLAHLGQQGVAVAEGDVGVPRGPVLGRHQLV